MSELDPELAAAIEPLRDLPAWSDCTVEDARTLEDETFGGAAVPDDDELTTECRTIPAAGHDIWVRLYRPSSLDTPAPVLLFAHGGGFVLGTLDSADDLARRLATATDHVVVSVDYRLAPEHPYPAGLNDVTTVAAWLLAEAADLGIDPDRLGVAGSSAGANLAAGVARRFRDRPTSLTCQVLFYPMLDPGLDRASHREQATGPLLTRDDLAWFWDLYLDDDQSPNLETVTDPLIAPLAADDFTELPPAVVVTAGNDPLRDEGRAYADHLDEAGVPVADLHYPGACHGFLSLADEVTLAADAWEDLSAAYCAYRNE
ncbi:alpha/beta hydrolase [Haloarchaeobius sp. DFWS5]|uniref:alpha/beta hydrolase n=1 Tax=Haloarchaeobius sp. DFWS5 TaxID=3446114 RepID=UPI003EBAA9DB